MTTAFNSTLGALLLGYTGEVFLYGVTVLQNYLYFRKCAKRDGRLQASLVGFLFFLNALHLIFTSHAVWHYFVANYGNVIALLIPIWSLGAQGIVTSISDLIIRYIFARRIWKLSHGNVLLIVLMGVLSLAAFASSFTLSYKAMFLTQFADIGQLQWVLITGLSSSMSLDIILAAGLSYLLSQNRSAFVRMDNLVNKLILYGVSTGAITAVCALVVLVTYLVFPDNFIWLAFFLLLGSLFFNSLLASLNARESLMKGGQLSASRGTVSARNHPVNLQDISSSNKSAGRSSEHHNPLAAHIETMSHTTIEQKFGRPNQWDEESSPVLVIDRDRADQSPYCSAI